MSYTEIVDFLEINYIHNELIKFVFSYIYKSRTADIMKELTNFYSIYEKNIERKNVTKKSFVEYLNTQRKYDFWTSFRKRKNEYQTSFLFDEYYYMSQE